MARPCADGKVEEVLSPALSEDLFKSAITRERKRTERSGLAIVLVVIRVAVDGRDPGSPKIWEAIGEALRVVKSDIDLVGWFEQDTVMGLLSLDINMSELTYVSECLEANIRKQLADRLDAEWTSHISIRLRVYPEPICSEEEAFLSIDSYLYPELHVNRVKYFGYDLVKRGLDIIGSFTLLMVLSPIFLVVALCVRLTSSGPVIFRQIRFGQMMKPFMICKFRTMRANADHGIHQNYVSWFITASDRNKAQRPEQDKVFKLTNDLRITPIGHFLRKTSLDELPQLWNVLKGEMSLVGPRPPLWYELQQYKPWHRHRLLEVKPGITGLWQVTGRSQTTFEEMVRLDLRYARERSLWADIKILLATPKAVMSGKGAC